MAMSARSHVSTGIAAVAATTLTLSATIAAPVPRTPIAHAAHTVAASASPSHAFAVRLLAAIQHEASTAPPGATPVSSTPQLPAAAAKSVAAPAASITAGAATFGLPGVQNAIINTYNTVMPWVDWGVEVGQWAVGWVPWVGWVGADQVGIFYYDLIRPLITSGVYNTAYVIGGTVGLFPAIGNFINDLGYTIRGFIRSEINWALSFLPPLPPLPFAATKAVAAKSASASAAAATTPDAAPTKTEKAARRDHSRQAAPTTDDRRDIKAEKRHPAPAKTDEVSGSSANPAASTTDDGKTGKTKADKHFGKTDTKRGTGKRADHRGGKQHH